jgi:hypothetical protein
MTKPSDRDPARSLVRPRSATSVPRRHARLLADLPVQCSRATGPGAQAWRGRTVDVSGGGFAIKLPKRLPPGTRVSIEVRTGIGPIQMKAEIVWTRRAAGSTGPVLHGLCLADRSELLELPIAVLLGQWLTNRARNEGDRPTRPAARKKKLISR